MASSSFLLRLLLTALVVAVLLVGLGPGIASSETRAIPSPTIEGPIPGSLPGDPLSPVLADTYPFFSTSVDLA